MNRNRRYGSRGQRGAMLIEALVAIAVLGVGTAGLAGMISAVTQANRRQSFQNKSLEVFAAVATQVKSANCDVFPPLFLPGAIGSDAIFAGAMPSGWIDAQIAGSSLTMIGDSAGATGWDPGLTPPMRIEYYMELSPAPVANYQGPPSFDLEVRVREVTLDPTKDAPTAGTPDAPTPNGYWIRSFPLKKVCNARPTDISTVGGRGEVP